MGKIYDVALMMRKLKDGDSTVQVAKFFGVTPWAVNKRAIAEAEKIERQPDLQRSELSRDNINTVEQLRVMNDHILSELKRSRRLVERADDRVKEYEGVEDELRLDPGNKKLGEKLKGLGSQNVADILKIQSNIIAISGEVRKQIELQVKIYETIYNVQMVAEFQEEILNILREASPDLRNEAIKRLKARRSIRGLVRLEK
jgi:hypothetical protein